MLRINHYLMRNKRYLQVYLNKITGVLNIIFLIHTLKNIYEDKADSINY